MFIGIYELPKNIFLFGKAWEIKVNGKKSK